MYANAWFIRAREPEEFAAKAKQTVALGIKALKWDPFGKSYMTIEKEQMEKSVAIVSAVREAVGSNVELLIECHGRFNPTTAVEISKELAQFKVKASDLRPAYQLCGAGLVLCADPAEVAEKQLPYSDRGAGESDTGGRKLPDSWIPSGKAHYWILHVRREHRSAGENSVYSIG